MSFADKVALVYGAGGGMGLNIANDLLGAGAHVGLADLKPEPDEIAVGPGSARYHQGDATDESFIKEVTQSTMDAYGRVDYLVNTTGVLEIEKERIFSHSWLLAGHIGQLPEVGSYFSLDLLGERLFFIRGEDDEIRGFYNVCRHRAHELVQGSGCTQSITCPYHAWTYALDGTLRHARHSGQVAGFDPAQHGLASVRVERFLNFVLFNLDPNASSFAALVPDLESEIRAYVPRLDDLVTDRRRWDRIRKRRCESCCSPSCGWCGCHDK